MIFIQSRKEDCGSNIIAVVFPLEPEALSSNSIFPLSKKYVHPCASEFLIWVSKVTPLPPPFATGLFLSVIEYGCMHTRRGLSISIGISTTSLVLVLGSLPI